MKRNGTILDSLMQEIGGLDRKLGASDRTKLSAYLDSVREKLRVVTEVVAVFVNLKLVSTSWSPILAFLHCALVVQQNEVF